MKAKDKTKVFSHRISYNSTQTLKKAQKKNPMMKKSEVIRMILKTYMEDTLNGMV